MSSCMASVRVCLFLKPCICTTEFIIVAPVPVHRSDCEPAASIGFRPETTEIDGEIWFSDRDGG